MATKKIPTFESNLNIKSGFKAPVLKDATVSILQSVNDISQDHLDIKAAKEGEQQGFEQVEKGTLDIKEAMKKPNTIRGSAFKKGASSSFIAKTEQQYETELAQLKNENIFDIDTFNKKAKKLRDQILSTTPADLQQAIGQGFDQKFTKNQIDINTQSFIRGKEEELKIETDRIVDLNNKIYEGIISNSDDVEEMVAKVAFHLDQLYNVNKTIDVQTLSAFQDSLYKSILTAEIKRSYEATPNLSKEKFIEALEKDGYKTFIKDLKTSYQDEIKKALPQFKIPDTMDPKLIAGVISDLKSEFREMVDSRKSESLVAETSFTKTIETALQNDTPIDQAMPLPALYKIAEENFWDNEKVEAMLNVYKQAELTQTFTKNYKTMNIDLLTDTIKDYKEVYNALDQSSTEDQLKGLALQDSIKILEDRSQALKNVIGNPNPYKVLGTDGIIDITNINETTSTELKNRRIKTANKLSVPVELIPLVDQNEIKALTSQLASNDINAVNQTINLITSLKLDNNIDVLQEILEAEGVSSRATIIEIALELPDGAERSMMLEAEIRKEEIKTILDSRKDGSKGSKDTNNKKKLSDHLTEMNINSMSDKAKAINFYETIIDYQISKGVDFDNAMKKADELYQRAFRPVEYSDGKFVIIPHSLYENGSVDKSISKLDNIKQDPVAYNFVCDETQTFAQCESAFQNALNVEREGTQLVLKSSVNDADLGTTGQTFSMAGEQLSNGDYAVVPMLIEMDSEKQLPVQVSKKFAKGWNYNINQGSPNEQGSWKQTFNSDAVIKEIPEFEKNRNVNDTPIEEIQKSILEIVGGDREAFKNKRDEMLAYEEKEKTTRAFYASITNQAGYIDGGAMNIAAMEYGQEVVVNGILLKNAQPNAKWTEWELDYLSKFDDLDGLENPRVKDYVINKWSELQSQGGYSGKGTGAKLPPAASLYMLVKEAERSL